MEAIAHFKVLLRVRFSSRITSITSGLVVRAGTALRKRLQTDNAAPRVRQLGSYFPSTENASNTLPGAPPNIPYPELT